MQSCIGVYLRVQMDHARAYWPVNSNPECCFTLINRDADKNVYLVAEESKIAQYENKSTIAIIIIIIMCF